jgi:probable rRNA maturation factor
VIEIEVEAPDWTRALPDAEAVTMRAAQAALSLSPAHAGEEKGIAILLTDDSTVRDLNARFLGKDKPTNVLSFPAPPDMPGTPGRLGDIALAYGVCAREAEEQGKSLAQHLSHLTVHGVLHLLGYDHETDGEAEAMEAVERAVLEVLGVPDPYAADRVSDRS